MREVQVDILIKKLIAYLPKNLGAIIGILQAGVKFAKELATLLADALFIPQSVVDKIRAICNAVDGILEKIKAFLLKVGN